MTILIVNPDEAELDKISAILTEDGQKNIITVSDLDEGIEYATLYSPSVIVSSAPLGNKSPLKILEAFKKKAAGTPIITLIKPLDNQLPDHATEADMLNAGAADVIHLPFSQAVLAARVKTAIRHGAGLPCHQVAFGPFTLNLSASELTIKGRDEKPHLVHLWPKAFLLLELLCLNPDKIVPYQKLLDHIYGENEAASPGILRVLVCRLRNTMEDALINYGYKDMLFGKGEITPITTVMNKGFMLVTQNAEPAPEPHTEPAAP